MKTVLVSMFSYYSYPIRILHSLLKQNGYDVNSIFLAQKQVDEFNPPTEGEKELLISTVKELKPSLVGFSMCSTYFGVVKELTQRIKKELPDVTIIWGGPHPTISPETCIGFTDAVCIGEGEGALLELAKSLETGKENDSIPNLWINKGGRITKNKPRALIKDLDSVPFPAYGEKGMWFIRGGRLIKEDLALYNSTFKLMSSRGCPFNCTYCCNNAFHKLYTGGNIVRRRSVENVIQEIEQAKKRFHSIKRLEFYDDVFATDIGWLHEFKDEYSKRVCLPFACNFFPNTTTDEIVKTLKEAGLDICTVGVQSGSERTTVHIFKRYVPNEAVLRTASLFKKYGIDAMYEIIIDNPFEDDEDRMKTAQLFLDIPRPFRLNAYSLIYFPKTELTEMALKAGFITENDLEDVAQKVFDNWSGTITLKYKRSKSEEFWAATIDLIATNMLSNGLLANIIDSKMLRAHPAMMKPIVAYTHAYATLAKPFKALELVRTQGVGWLLDYVKNERIGAV